MRNNPRLKVSITITARTWVKFEGLEYLISDESSLHTFNDSRSICEKHGGDLAVIPDIIVWNRIVYNLPQRKAKNRPKLCSR